MKEFLISSKIYLFPTDKAIRLSKIFNICLIIIIVAGAGSILTSGADIANVSMIITTLVVSSMFKRKDIVSPKYEFCIVKILFYESKLELQYEDKGVVSFFYNNIITLEYSDQLQCLRITGNYDVTGEIRERTSNRQEWMLYMEDDQNIEVCNLLQLRTGKEIIYMDL